MNVKLEPDGDMNTGAGSAGHTLQVRIRLIVATFRRMCVYVATRGILCNMHYIHRIKYVLQAEESNVWSGFKTAFNISRLAARPSNVHGHGAVLFFSDTILYSCLLNEQSQQ